MNQGNNFIDWLIRHIRKENNVVHRCEFCTLFNYLLSGQRFYPVAGIVALAFKSRLKPALFS